MMPSKSAPVGTLLTVRRGTAEGLITLVVRTETGSRAYPVAESFYCELGAPAAGYLLSEEETERILVHTAQRRALASSLASLSHGDESRRSLYLKLRRKGHSDEAARTAIAEVERLGFLREDASALRLVAHCAGQGWSRRKTFAYLARRGYPSSVISRAIEEAEAAGDADFEENKRLFCEEQRALGCDPETIRRALWRAGF